MNLFLLIGVLIVIVGFALKIDTIATVVTAGVVTGLIAGQPIKDILSTLGTAFVGNRLATLFVLTLPVIGVLERYGLRDKATDFVKKLKSATTGRIITFYQVVRTLAAAFSLRLGGHAQFIRPLIQPMATAATEAKYGAISETENEKIKGLSAAAENFGNFFAQNIFVGASGTLLIVSTLNEAGLTQVTAQNIALWSIPVGIISVVVSAIYYYLYDQKVKAHYQKKSDGTKPQAEKEA